MKNKLTDPKIIQEDIKEVEKKLTKHHYVDNNDFTQMTKIINGGTIGLEDRVARFNHAMSVLA